MSKKKTSKTSKKKSVKPEAYPIETIETVPSGKCFISHCTDDKEIMDGLTELFSSVYECDIQHENELVFCTYHNGVDGGMDLDEKLNEALRDCSTMIAIITDSYLRSHIALYELCSFKSMNKPIVPIVFNGAVGINFINEILGNKRTYIEIGDTPKQMIAEMLLKTFKENGIADILGLKKDAQHHAVEFLEKAVPAVASRPYIGCDDEKYEKVIKACSDMGVMCIRDSGSADLEKLKKCSELYVVSTTGGFLMRTLAKEVIPHVLMRQGKVTFLLPNKESEFCRNVAELEDQYNGVKHNVRRIGEEFENAVNYLKECYSKTKARAEKDGKPMGNIYIGCTFNLLRQTVILGVNGTHVSGWFAATIPPQRTSAGTPTIDFSSENAPHTIGGIMYEHVCELRKFSSSKGQLYEISSDSSFESGFFLEKPTAEQYWKERYAEAEQNMKIHNRYNGILIEVAAQHPLKEHIAPGVEFEARLDRAAELYESFKATGRTVKIYVPGSLHHDVRLGFDDIPLSTAGVEYLKNKGIPKKDLLGDDMNRKYKGDDGVYNSADECFVSSEIFKHGDFKTLCCVCSPNQMIRKKFFYIEMGVLPDFHTAPCESMYHDDVDEIFDKLPKVLYGDHNWQSPDSEAFINSRKARKPEK